jgi:hypothetical protein
LDVPVRLLNQIEFENEEFARLEKEIAELEMRLKGPDTVKESVPEKEAVRDEGRGRKRGCFIWWGSLNDGTKAAYIGLIGVVTAAIIGLTGALSAPIITELTKLLFVPTATPTPTKTPVTILSPTITDTPTLTPMPSPTPTPTPYYVEIVVDASERMAAEFEGGTTKMESAWQTAGTIGRTRAQKGQFVSIRTFGSGSEQTDMGCFESYSVFSFTNQDSDIKARLTTPPIPCGQAAVVTALTDASANLMAHENIGREIILLTGGEDGCGSDLSVFYSSDNQALWTQTFVILFADEDFGPFINLRAQGANINYNLVRNRAEAEAVAKKVADSPPPATPMPTPTPTRGTATAIHTPTPIATPLSTPTSVATPTPPPSPTNMPTPTKTATSTPTTTPTNTLTSTPTPTFTLTPTPDVVTKDKPVEPGIFADSDQVNMANRATAFREAYKGTAAINSTAFSPGSDDSTSIRIAYDRVNADHWALWGIVLPETDVSSLKLAFDIKGQVGGERPNVWLVSSGSPSEVRNVVDIEDYVTVTTNWQRAEIPPTDFRDPWGHQQPIDLTRILRVEIAFEWENMAGMVYVDGFAFEP